MKTKTREEKPMKKTHHTTSELRVHVTDQHIDAGIRCDSNRCMIADATKDAAKKINWRITMVKVDLATIRFSDPKAGRRYIWLTPAHVRAGLIMFETGQRPASFAFVLRRSNVAQVVDTARISRFPSRVRRREKVAIVTRPGKRNHRRLQSVKITGGKPLPLMPRQTTRMFGFCGLSPALFQQMKAGTLAVAKE